MRPPYAWRTRCWAHWSTPLRTPLHPPFFTPPPQSHLYPAIFSYHTTQYSAATARAAARQPLSQPRLPGSCPGPTLVAQWQVLNCIRVCLNRATSLSRRMLSFPLGPWLGCLPAFKAFRVPSPANLNVFGKRSGKKSHLGVKLRIIMLLFLICDNMGSAWGKWISGRTACFVTVHGKWKDVRFQVQSCLSSFRSSRQERWIQPDDSDSWTAVDGSTQP
jgi:hypothetical protein